MDRELALAMAAAQLTNPDLREPKADDCYSVVRFRFRNGEEVIKRGLTLAEAQSHCKDPQTSSKTATSKEGRAYTRQHGEWFDGYRRER